MLGNAQSWKGLNYLFNPRFARRARQSRNPTKVFSTKPDFQGRGVIV